MSFSCVPCDRYFGSEDALQQHKVDSPAHALTFLCETCNRLFKSDEALEQHLRNSPVHALSFDCSTCNRSFRSEEALEQHSRDFPTHARTFDCVNCGRSFGSEEALIQHCRDSPVHALTFDCEPCNRTFSSSQALEQHIRDSSSHQPVKTPLDVFFGSFRSFDYDPSLSPAISYTKLQKHKNWRRGDAASTEAWERYQDALEAELRMWYGAEDDLTAWHTLCRAVGITPLPRTCQQCQEAVRRTHVNIVDLIEWGRKRNESEERVKVFKSVPALRDYSKRTGKIFSNTLDGEESNGVLRHLLRKLFRGNL